MDSPTNPQLSIHDRLSGTHRIGRLQCHVIDVNDLAVAEAFWSELTGLPVIPSVFPGRYSYLGQADPWRHEVILHLVRAEKGPEPNRSHVDIWVRDVDRAIEQVEAYEQLFDTRALELLQRGQPLGYQHTVATTWSLALERLRDSEPAAVDLLTLASFLGPDDPPQPLLAAHAQELPEPLARAATDPLALADTVAALRRYSLVRVVADGLYVHRLLQAVVRAAEDADTERAWVATAVRLLRAGFPDRSSEVADWPECQRLLPHALVAADHGRRLDVESAGWLWLLHQVALYLRSRGQYRQALALYERALVGRKRVLGDHHPDTLTSLNDLADIRRSLGDFQGARQVFEQTSAARRRVLGDNHPETLWSMNNLAETRRALGDLQALTSCTSRPWPHGAKCWVMTTPTPSPR
jgi:tetratricopeptide (TPR) repeat protein